MEKKKKSFLIEDPQLDTKIKTFKGFVNGIDKGIAFNNINLSQNFYFAASIFRPDDSIQIINFKQMYLISTGSETS